MKAIKTTLATLAATAVLAGCAKEITSPSFENDKVNQEGSRVIAVSFAPQTKTEFDGFQPKFVDNDSILISNGVAIDTCDVEVEGNVATISTNLTGPLTAVYPYKAAKMNDSNHNLIDTVLVSTVQDGTFASANICMAKMTGENEESLSFENKTAVFCIKPAAGASSEYVEVKAEGFNIANNIPAESAFTDSSTIRVPSVIADSVYVSILVPDGLKVSNLIFYDGTKEKTITGEKASTTIAAGTLYTVDNKNWASPEEAFIVPTDEENGINPTSFCVKSSDRDFTYWIGRTASEKACTVPIINHSDSRFTVPSSVTFQAGEAQAPLTITFSDTLPEEEDCTVSFEIGGEYAAGSGSFAGVLKYIPFYKRVCGNYTSDEIISYFGDKVTFNFTVVPSEDDSTGKVIFENLDPISFGSGGTAENGYNKPYGLLDEENSMITIPVQGFGYESWDFLGFDAPTLDESEYYYTPIYIRFDGNDTLTFTNAWGIITDPEAWEYWSFYNGGFSCKKNTGTIQQSVYSNAAPKPLSLHKLGKTYIDARK